jgi:hypothetical protein
MLPNGHQAFLDRALPVFQHDERFVGVAAAGSWITGSMDEYSDLDLIAVADPRHYDDVISSRSETAASLGQLLNAFTGEHVGEPRLLICLYDDPLLHVDVKFVALDDLKTRIENPVVLWERDQALSNAIARSEPKHPMPDLQWIEDRFWTWVHYAALRLGRGELFEVIDFLSFIRSQVLGPLALVSRGQLPRGVRRLETLAMPDVPDFARTVPAYDRESCASAIEASVELYLRLRDRAGRHGLGLRSDAQRASIEYLRRIIAAKPKQA